MKLQIEGSDRDIRGLFNDPTAIKDAALNQLRNENLEKELLDVRAKLEESIKDSESLKKTLWTAAQKCGELNNGAGALRMELGAKNAHIAAQDAEIQRLKFMMNDPVKLSSEQEARVEELYQNMVAQYSIKPLSFTLPDSSGKSISAEHVISTIMSCLAAGNKVGACKEIRAVTSMPLVKTRDMLHAALLAFGCHTNEKGNPVPMIGPKAALTSDPAG
jgi:predicted nuclease with TOPRIM domain